MKVLRLSVAVFTVGVLTSVLTLVNAISPNVIFSQCECDPGLGTQTFSSIVGTNEASITTVTTTTSSFVCSDGIAGTVDPTFPGTPGIVHSDLNSNGEFQVNINSAFVTGTDWFGVTSMELTSYRTGATVNIAVVGGQTLSAAVAGSSQVILTAAGSLAIKAINASALGRADFVFGKHSSLGAFICMVQPDFSISVCQNNNAVGAAFASDSTMDLQSYPGTVFSFFLGTPDFSAVTTLANLETFAASSVPVKPFAVPVPKSPISSPTTAEDTAVALDLTTSTFIANPTSATGLTFGVTLSNGAVSSGTLSSGIFGFTPSLNLNDDNTASFTQAFTVTLDNVCFSPSGSFQVSVSAINDAPTATSPSSNVPVFASVDYDSTVSGNELIIANDVDDGGVMIAGSAVIDAIPASGTIHKTCGSSALTTGGSLDIVNGNVVFCFKPGNNFLAGVTQSLLLTVHDNDTPPPGDLTAANQVTITFEGGNPLTPASNAQFIGIEGSTATTVTLASLGTKQDGGNFTIILTELPSIGTLNINSVAAQLGVIYPTASPATYTAAAATYFNRNGIGNFVDGVGQALGGCGVPSGCPVTFTYLMSNADATLNSSTTATAKIFVDAVDNKQATITAQEFIITPVNTAKSISEMTIQSDNDNQVFPVTLTITGADGATFTWDPNANSNLVSGKIAQQITILEGENCSTAFCTLATANGVPAILEELAATVKMKANENNLDPRVAFEVFANGDADKDAAVVRFQFSAAKAAFFDDENNIYYVGGGGAVAMLVLLTLFVYMRVQGGRAITKETLLNVAEQAVDIEIRGQKQKQANKVVDGKTKVLDGKKSIKLGVDDEIFDWEKHIDKESGEVYFFNPKTGESQWDPPTVKNYSL